MCAPQPAWAADETLLLEVRINGNSSGKIGEFVLREAIVLAQPDELAELGFRLPEAVDRDLDEPVALSDLPELTWRLDQTTQTLFVTVPVERLVPQLLETDTPTLLASETVESGTGVTLNYDLVGIASQASTAINGLIELRAFSPFGIVNASFLGFSSDDAGARPRFRAVRLDTAYSYADTTSGRRYTVGDFITTGLAWTRPIRMGGVQLTADFSTRPDLITFPLPSIRSSVTTPSTVDVFANGNALVSRQIAAGPFEIPQLPVVTGAGTISMAVTDALGRQVTTNLSFYASSELLAPSLQTYALELGKVRRNWGVLSNDYGTLAARTSYRRGITDNLTIEGAGEATRGTVMAGIGAVLNVADFAIVNTAVSASTGRDGSGAQIRLGVQRLAPVFSFAASATFASRGYADIAAANSEPVPKSQINGSLGLSLDRLGSIGIAYAAIDRRPTTGNSAVPVSGGLMSGPLPPGNFIHFPAAQQTRILSANYSVQIGALTLYATGFRSVSQEKNSGVVVGLSIPLGRGTSASATAGSDTRGSYGQLQASRSASRIGEVGYQLFGSAGQGTRAFAQVEYKAPWAWLAGGIDHAGRQTTARLEARGAISTIGGNVFATNTIYDSFALVDTDGLAGVSVLHENRPAGKTDANGQLLVTDLQAFTINHLAIAPLDIPFDVTLDHAVRDIRPQDRSGVIVKFPVKVSRAALLRLIDEDGQAVAVGSTATLRGSRIAEPVGYEGETYILDLKPHNVVDIVQPDGRRCSASFDYVRVPGTIPVIGPMACVRTGS